MEMEQGGVAGAETGAAGDEEGVLDFWVQAVFLRSGSCNRLCME